MRCLFIDTSLTSVSIAVVEDGVIKSIIQEDIPNMHSVYATSFVKKVIDLAGIDANMIDKIMVVNGPGSFTGLRIGVTIAKTYGYLIKKEITPVSSLRALAISSNHKGVVMSLIPANKSDYYVAIYEGDKTLFEPMCVKGEEVYKLCQKYLPYVVGVDASVIGNYKINKVKLDVEKVVEYYLYQDSVNCHKLLPNYLNQPQAVLDKMKN